MNAARYWKERGDGLVFLMHRNPLNPNWDYPAALYGDFGDCWTYSSTAFRGYAIDAEAAKVAVLANDYARVSL